MDATLHLVELYRSIQGESTFAGLPCTFVRTAGCDLRCAWCDSTYTFGRGEPWTVGAILEEVRRLGTRLVEVTGGEPLLQPAALPLMAALLERGHTVLLETSGAHPIEAIPDGVHVILDLKAPGSGEAEKNRLENLERLGPGDEVKIVLAGREDYLWAREVLEAHAAKLGGVERILSPAAGLLDPAALAAWILEDGLEVRLGLQLHKVVWPGRDRGV